MTSEQLLAALLQLIAGGRTLAIQPSLVNLNMDLSQASIIRVDNLTIHIPVPKVFNPKDTVANTPLPPLIVEDKEGRKAEIVIAETQTIEKLPQQPSFDSMSAIQYRLEPHFIFDKQSDANTEYSVAPRVMVAVIGESKWVHLRLFNATRTKYAISVDSNDDFRPHKISIEGAQHRFSNRRSVTIGASRKFRWTYSKFPYDRATRIGSEAGGSSLVTVAKCSYRAAWKLTCRELTKTAILPHHFLLLKNTAHGE